ncbi:MAG: hypothetical protein ABWY93_36550 [Mycobacterium sp.]
MLSRAVVQLHAATPDDHTFIVEMARYVCIIDDRPLPDLDDDEVLKLLPPPGEIPILAEDASDALTRTAWAGGVQRPAPRIMTHQCRSRHAT